MKAKRIISIAVVALFMLTIAVLPTAATASFTFKPTAASTIVKTGSDITISIKGTNPSCNGYNFGIEFPKDLLTYKSADHSKLASYVDAEAADGKLEAYQSFGATSNEDAEIMTVTFTAASTISGASQDALITLVKLDDYLDSSYTPVDNSAIDLSTTLTISVKIPHTAPVVDASISGTATSGQTLTAGATTTDNWDLTPTYTYQWKSNGTDIAGATAQTYALTADDFDKKISVAVTATVDADENKTATDVSSETANVAVPNDQPTLTVVESRNDTVAVGAELDTNATATAATLVGGDATLAYSWKVNNVEVATTAKYAPTIADYGTGESTIKCVVKATSTRNSAEIEKTVDFTNAIVAGNMKPAISNLKVTKNEETEEATTAVVGDTLNAAYTFTDIADASTTGLGDTDVSTIQWYRGADAIEGATEETYTLVPADISKNITVKVIAKSSDATPNTNIADYGDVTLGNDLTSTAVAADYNPTYKPEVTNLTVSPSNIKVNGVVTVAYDYNDKNGYADASTIKFEIADTADGAYAEITGATAGVTISANANGTTIKLDKTFVGKFLKITVSPKNANDITDIDVVSDISYEVKKAATSGSGALTGPSLVTGTPSVSPSATPSTTPSTTPGTQGGEAKFDDLANYDWAVAAIDALVKDEVIYGISDTKFAPAENVTRAQFTAFMARALDLIEEDAKTAYTDVADSYWGYKEIASCEALGVFDYLEGAAFAPDEELGRDEMALIAYNTAKAAGITLPEIAESITFDDAASIAPAATDAVAALSQAGIIVGNGDGTFAPAATTIRAAAAKVVYMISVLK